MAASKQAEPTTNTDPTPAPDLAQVADLTKRLAELEERERAAAHKLATPDRAPLVAPTTEELTRGAATPEIAAKIAATPPPLTRGRKIPMLVRLVPRLAKVHPDGRVPHPVQPGVELEVESIVWLQPNVADHWRRRGYCVHTRYQDTPEAREGIAPSSKPKRAATE